MSDVQLTGIQFHVILTPHEFGLVTRGLLRTIPDEPEWQLSKGSPRGTPENKGERKVEIDLKALARELAFRLMERRKYCMEKQVDKAEFHIQKSLELEEMDDDQ
tara:strand:- start:34 stop:345 length:312 start_codon:yes stop_codon:yes gene_type:complete